MGTPPDRTNTPAPRSLADVVETLAVEFEADLGIQTVVQVVRRCHRELDIAGESAGQLEPQARRRLNALATIKSREAGSGTNRASPDSPA